MNQRAKQLGAAMLAWAVAACAALGPRTSAGEDSVAPAGSQFLPRDASRGPALPLAGFGFCPVTLHDAQRWERGNPALGAIFDGRQYLFASERELEIFSAAPIVYAPVLGGDCIVTYAESGERVAGRAEFGLLRDGRMYFFADATARAGFIAAPKQYVDADLADDGQCLVSRVERGRIVAGRPETAVMCDGMRRLFAGAYEQRLYLENPERYDAASETRGDRALAMNAATSGGGPEPEASSAEAPEGAEADDGESGDGAEGEENGDEAEESLADPLYGGYCPVTLREKGLWVRGRYEDRVEYETLDFLTAGPEEHDAFLADPVKYIPVLAGECAVSLIDQDKKVRGSVFHMSQYKGRLFLFADAAHKAAFKADPAKYANADVAADGACVVTLAEKDVTEPGFAEFATWFNGKLYRFRGAVELQKFLETPERYAVRDGK